MLIKRISDLFNFVVAAIDGVYGWTTEAISLLIVVLIFNFLVRWGLQRLEKRFSHQKRIWHESFVRALYKPLAYYIWFFTIVHLLDLIAITVTDLASIENMHLVLGIGGVIFFSWFLFAWKKDVIQRIMMKSKNHEINMDMSRVDMIDKLLTLLIIFLTGLVLLEITESSVNTLIAFGGVGGLALAIASQEIIANFFAGFMIYATHPFSKGDWVQFPEKSIEGIVEEIGWYMTRIRGMDKRPIYVPNSTFSRVVVINPSRMTHRQFKEIIGLRYDDMPVVKPIMAEIKAMLLSHPDIDRNQKLQVHFHSFAAYSVEIVIECFTSVTDTEGFSQIRDDLLFKIQAIISGLGAQMAFPTNTTFYISEPVPLVKKEAMT